MLPGQGRDLARGAPRRTARARSRRSLDGLDELLDELPHERVGRAAAKVFAAFRPGRMRPRWRTAIRSARRKASARSCVTSRTAAESDRFHARNSRWIARRAIGSSAPKGSSISTSGGSAASARATPTRWRWPPESSRGSRAENSPGGSPTVSSKLVGAGAALLLRPAQQPRHRLDVLAHRPVRKEAALLDDVADPAAQGRGLRRAHRLAEDAHLARVGVEQAVRELQGGGLAAARGPDERDRLSRRDGEREAFEHRSSRREALSDPDELEHRSGHG